MLKLDTYTPNDFDSPRIPLDVNVVEYENFPLAGEMHPCDRIVFQLLPDQQNIVLDRKEIIINSNEFVTYSNNKLRIDALGIVANEFGRRTGNFVLDISGFRSAMYQIIGESISETGGIEDIPFTTIQEADPGNIILTPMEITEISSTRKEVRLKPRPNTLESYDDFLRFNKPGMIPNEVYYTYKTSGPVSYQDVYYSETSHLPDYDKTNDLSFGSEIYYNKHRSERGYPEDLSGVERRVMKGEGDNTVEITHRAKPISSNRLWPCILSYINPTRPNERQLSVTTNWRQHILHNKDNDGNIVPEDTLIFRLAQPLPANIQVGGLLEVIQETFTAYQIPIDIDLQDEIVIEYGLLRGPNLKVDVNERSGNETILKSFNDLTGTNTSVKNKIVNNFISGSNTIEQNYDFRKFSNFVHFSSAEERVRNFQYKLTQIEHFVSKSKAVSTDLIGKSQAAAASSSVFVANKTFYDNQAENIKASFDAYENYLYYTSHSTELVDNVLYNSSTWPKSNSEKSAGSYNLFSVSSSEGIAWFNSQITSASIYDAENTSRLRNVIPTHIKADSENDQYQLFFDMIGQHFDDLFFDIKNLEEIHQRDEDVNIGLSKDLIYDQAKSFGWTLQSGFDTSELWQILLGTDSEGVYQASGSGETLTHVKKESKSHKDIETQTWKRVINNLPYLLKTKGTSRGLRALLASYGLPETILRIQEFGGPTKKKASTKRELTKFNYALDMSGSSVVKLPWTPFRINSSDQNADGTYFANFSSGTANLASNSLQSATQHTNNSVTWPSMIEFRFDTTVTQSMHLVGTKKNAAAGTLTPASPNWRLRLEHSSSAAGMDAPHAIAAGSQSAYCKYGRLVLEISSSDGLPAISASTDYAPFYDNDWWNVAVSVSELPKFGTSAPESQSFSIRYAAASEHSNGRLTYTGSAVVVGNSSSYSKAWIINNDTLESLGFGDRFVGQTSDSHKPTAVYNNPVNGSFQSASLASFSGSMQEIRLWAFTQDDAAFHQHTLAPTSVVGDTIKSAFGDLLIRLPLGTDGKKYDLSSTTNITGSQPNLNNSLGGYSYYNVLKAQQLVAGFPGGRFENFSGTPFSPKTETYYVEVPSTAGPRANSNKIRIEDNRLRNNQLSRTVSFEESSFDSNPLDTEDISVTLSPADQIDTDISMQFGGFDLDDYIGDPRDRYKTEYTSLRDTKNLYFKKFSTAYNVWEFIKLLNSMNKGLFRQIESMLPARADAVVGIEIRPNLLERVKLGSPASMSLETQYFTGSVRVNSTASISSQAQSKQTFQGSEYTVINAPIDLGVRSSQQNATSSGTYMNRFIEGSEYKGVSFSQATLSAALTYISESRRQVGEYKYIKIPTWNKYYKPHNITGPNRGVRPNPTRTTPLVVDNERNLTGSAWITVFEDNFTSFPTMSGTPGSPTDLIYKISDRSHEYRKVSAPASPSEFKIITNGGLQIGNNTGNDQLWVQWNNPLPFQPNTLYKMTVTVSQSQDTDNDAKFFSGFSLFSTDGLPDGEMMNISLSTTSASHSSQGYFVASGINLIESVDHTFVAYASSMHTNAYGPVATPESRLHSSFGGNPLVNGGNDNKEGGITYYGSQVKSGPNKGKRITHFSPMFLMNYNGDNGTARITHLKVEALPAAFVDVAPQYIYSPSQRRLVFDGCKMSSPDFNAPSPNTIDGGPVAEYQLVNPNVIVVDPGAVSTPDGPITVSPYVQSSNVNAPVAQQIIVR